MCVKQCAIIQIDTWTYYISVLRSRCEWGVCCPMSVTTELNSRASTQRAVKSFCSHHCYNTASWKVRKENWYRRRSVHCCFKIICRNWHEWTKQNPEHRTGNLLSKSQKCTLIVFRWESVHRGVILILVTRGLELVLNVLVHRSYQIVVDTDLLHTHRSFHF